MALARRGDASVLPRLRELLADRPDVWRRAGDLVAVAEQQWLTVAGGNDPLRVESLRRTMAELRAGLAETEPTPLVRMLVDQVVLVWLEVTYLQSLSAQTKGTSPEYDGLLLRRVESAQKRHAAAIQQLITVRALTANTPAVAPDQPLRVFDPKTEDRIVRRDLGLLQ